MSILSQTTNEKFHSEVFYAIIDHDAVPSTIVVLSPGRDLKERFLRSMREHYCWEQVAIKTPFNPDRVVGKGVSYLTITVYSDIDQFDINLEVHQTTVY